MLARIGKSLKNAITVLAVLILSICTAGLWGSLVSLGNDTIDILLAHIELPANIARVAVWTVLFNFMAITLGFYPALSGYVADVMRGRNGGATSTRATK